MDFLGTYLADEHESEQGSETPSSELDTSHFPSPKGPEELARPRKEDNGKDARSLLKPLFLNVRKDKDDDDDDDFDKCPIPTVPSDLLTPICTPNRGFFLNDKDFHSPASKSINVIDSMRTVYLTPKTKTRKNVLFEAKKNATVDEKTVQQEGETEEKEVDSGPIQSMLEYFKSNN